MFAKRCMLALFLTARTLVAKDAMWSGAAPDADAASFTDNIDIEAETQSSTTAETTGVRSSSAGAAVLVVGGVGGLGALAAYAMGYWPQSERVSAGKRSLQLDVAQVEAQPESQHREVGVPLVGARPVDTLPAPLASYQFAATSPAPVAAMDAAPMMSAVTHTAAAGPAYIPVTAAPASA